MTMVPSGEGESLEVVVGQAVPADCSGVKRARLDCSPSLDSNQEHYSIEIASNYYRVEVVVL